MIKGVSRSQLCFKKINLAITYTIEWSGEIRSSEVGQEAIITVKIDVARALQKVPCLFLMQRLLCFYVYHNFINNNADSIYFLNFGLVLIL